MILGVLELLIIAMILGGGLLLLGVVVIATMARGGSCKRGSQQSQAEETRLMQELNHGFSKMEKRVEALETLMLDKMDEK
jgi:hypothetical protein